MTQPVKTPIAPGIIARVVAGVKFMVRGGDTVWMGPGQPIIPSPQTQEDVKGRQFDYITGFNTRTTPRDEENVSFYQLRAFADGLDILRLVIETRKDQISRLKWKIVYKDADKKPDARCQKIQDALALPDQVHTWKDWIRMILEDLLVIDAPTIYPRPTLGGGLYALEPMDGALIKRVLDVNGRTPDPADGPAYQQIVKGIAAVDYTRDELIYKPRNLRTHKVYGYSPVEQIITTINIAIRRQLYQLQYYTEGSTPDLVFSVPSSWTPDQIKAFELYWNAKLSGNTDQRRRTSFVPDGVKPIDTKEKALTDEFDQWIARIVCYAFGISHQAFVKEVNKATAGTAKDIAIEEGLEPIMEWIVDLMELILSKQFKAPDLCFAWADEQDHDPLQQAQINQIYVAAKVLTPDEVRADLGRDPLTPEQKAELTPPPPPGLGGVGPDGKPLAPGAPKPGLPADGDPAPTSQETAEDAAKAALLKAQKKSPYLSRRSIVNARQ